MKVFVIEANDPDDFYDERLDGAATKSLLSALGIDCCYRIALNAENFEKALLEACKNRYDCIHLSCHGNLSGISIAGQYHMDWDEFTDIFQSKKNQVHWSGTLVMATCHGGTRQLSKSFRNKNVRPTIIFGSTKALTFSDYCTAWSILYSNIHYVDRKRGGQKVRTPSAIKALQKICACVDSSFVYRRYVRSKRRYVRFPSFGARFFIK